MNKNSASKIKKTSITGGKKIFPVPATERVGVYWQALNNVLDPELGVGIVDLGLIYNVEEKNKQVTVTMTLTSVGCPVGPSIMRMVQMELEKNAHARGVKIKLVWDPVWNKDMVDPNVRAMLFA